MALQRREKLLRSNCGNSLFSGNRHYKHLEGKDGLSRDVIGIYPMLQDETCHFLCADFNDDSFEKDVTVFREVCEELNVPICVERSRSGNGAHAWIFFE